MTHGVVVNYFRYRIESCCWELFERPPRRPPCLLSTRRSLVGRYPLIIGLQRERMSVISVPSVQISKSVTTANKPSNHPLHLPLSPSPSPAPGRGCLRDWPGSQQDGRGPDRRLRDTPTCFQQLDQQPFRQPGTPNPTTALPHNAVYYITNPAGPSSPAKNSSYYTHVQDVT